MRTFKKQILIPTDIEKAWAFFSRPENLGLITPEEMGFTIRGDNPPAKIYPGLIVRYKVAPLWRIKMNWTTEITHLDPPFMFVDEQRSGPYRFWHHQHHFKASGQGVVMTDILNYSVPGWMLGNMLDRIFIGKKIRDIFDYREAQIQKIFPSS